MDSCCSPGDLEYCSGVGSNRMLRGGHWYRLILCTRSLPPQLWMYCITSTGWCNISRAGEGVVWYTRLVYRCGCGFGCCIYCWSYSLVHKNWKNTHTCMEGYVLGLIICGGSPPGPHPRFLLHLTEKIPQLPSMVSTVCFLHTMILDCW